jgi:hypothetical protein
MSLAVRAVFLVFIGRTVGMTGPSPMTDPPPGHIPPLAASPSLLFAERGRIERDTTRMAGQIEVDIVRGPSGDRWRRNDA